MHLSFLHMQKLDFLMMTNIVLDPSQYYQEMAMKKNPFFLDIACQNSLILIKKN